MTELAVQLQPAFILQYRKYRETSLLLDVLTQDFGRVPILAKGVRKAKSKTAGILQPFIPLKLSFIGKASLKLLTGVETQQPSFQLTGLAWYCGFYLNELVELLLHLHDPHPEVFVEYQQCLSVLASAPDQIESALRLFEYRLLEYIGYGLALDCEADTEAPIVADKNYFFKPGLGIVAAENGLFSGVSLLALKHNVLTDSRILAEVKQLMRLAIEAQLQGKPLKSRAVINQIIKKL